MMNNVLPTTFLIAVILTGCGRSNEEQPVVERNGQLLSSPSPAVSPEIAMVDMDDLIKDAPLLSEKYPAMASEALTYARLADLPENILLRSEDILITRKDLDDQIAQAPVQMRAELEKNAFFVLAQMATQELLLKEAKDAGVTGRDEMAKIQALIESITTDAEASEADVKKFYDENKEMMGGAPFNQIKSRIRDHLIQEKQKVFVQEYINETGLRASIALSASWTAEQAVSASDNPVDKARASGNPTFVNFGAKGCAPCDMMEPIREDMKREYEGRLNVVFVNVNQDRMLASRYGIRGIPHLVFFDKDGKEVHTHTGFMPREQIEEWLEKIGVK